MIPTRADASGFSSWIFDSHLTSVAELAALEEPVSLLRDHSEGHPMLACGEQVLDRLLRMAVVEEPAGGSDVELGSGLGILEPELVAQEVGEHVVVAEELTGAVQPDQEERALLEVVQHRPGVGGTGHRVAQLDGEPPEHRGLEQEATDVGWLLLDHLLHEVLRDQTVAAGERVDGHTHVRHVLQGDRSELETHHPAIGAVGQSPDLVVGQLALGDRGEQLPGLSRCEGQIGTTDLDEPPRRSGGATTEDRDGVVVTTLTAAGRPVTRSPTSLSRARLVRRCTSSRTSTMSPERSSREDRNPSARTGHRGSIRRS